MKGNTDCEDACGTRRISSRQASNKTVREPMGKPEVPTGNTIFDVQSNNIQAAHGAKIYRLDTEKLFYLQSKGLDSDQARQLLISSIFCFFVGCILLV